MRPLRLSVRGFTAFREEQEIDFDGLDLFAIVGPTGSGKSSVLDAMTYALFGQVDRVDEKSTRQMISQGQPRLAVTLDFEVGRERFRVGRSMPRGAGATKIMVERWDGAEWRQAGDGADRVREANKLLERLVGLDFDGFTRSVLLPQGKFSAFMAGDAAERREILVDLLGLSLFERMGKRARQQAKEARDKAQWKEESVTTQYPDATAEALEAAQVAAAAAGERVAALGEAAKRVRAIAERWRAVAEEAGQLEACAGEAADLSLAAARHAEALGLLAGRAATADEVLRDAERVNKQATETAAAAVKARREAEELWGSAGVIVEAREKARRLAAVEAEAATRRTRSEAAESALPAATAAVSAAESVLQEAHAEAERLGAEREAADARLNEVRHAHAVADVVTGLKVGDDCPVCGEPLTALPKAPGAAALRQTERAEREARQAAEAGAKRAGEAEGELQRARDRLERAERDAESAREEVARCLGEATELRAALAGVFDGQLPEDPAAALDYRASEVERLVAEEASTSKRAADAERTLNEARGLSERLLGEAAAERAGLVALSVASIAERAGRVAADLDGPRSVELPPASRLAELAEGAASWAEALKDYGARLSMAARERAASGQGHVAEATLAAGGLVPEAPSLDALLQSVELAEREAIREHEQRKAEAERIDRDIKAVVELRRAASELRVRARLFSDLAKELQADRLIAFLQAEALRLLAVGGSTRLSSLSSGRYALAYEGDEFLVVDRWNGDETRSVRTLSGGETFLASLALALALAEQVSSLAVTEHASLDSLFLDEGFGTLDPETLDVVVEAIEQLGGDGRMVGVITHVRDLADRLPARLEVTKSPRGSTVRRAG
jgi:DNA repair protein SbcC/Rad50